MKAGIIGTQQNHRITTFHPIIHLSPVLMVYVHQIDMTAPVIIINQGDDAREVRGQGGIAEHRRHRGCSRQIDIISTVGIHKKEIVLGKIHGIAAACKIDVLDLVSDTGRCHHRSVRPYPEISVTVPYIHIDAIIIQVRVIGVIHYPAGCTSPPGCRGKGIGSQQYIRGRVSHTEQVVIDSQPSTGAATGSRRTDTALSDGEAAYGSRIGVDRPGHRHVPRRVPPYILIGYIARTVGRERNLAVSEDSRAVGFQPPIVLAAVIIIEIPGICQINAVPVRGEAA